MSKHLPLLAKAQLNFPKAEAMGLITPLMNAIHQVVMAMEPEAAEFFLASLQSAGSGTSDEDFDVLLDCATAISLAISTKHSADAQVAANKAFEAFQYDDQTAWEHEPEQQKLISH